MAILAFLLFRITSHFFDQVNPKYCSKTSLFNIEQSTEKRCFEVAYDHSLPKPEMEIVEWESADFKSKRFFLLSSYIK